jgi:ATP-dependent Lon protease
VPGTGSATWVQIELLDHNDVSPRARELAREYRATLESIVESRGVPQIAEFLRGIDDPGQIADMAGYSPDLSFERKVEILETVDVEERLEKVLAWAKDTLAEVEVKERIRDEVSENLEKRQREMILREQMAAIRKELGDDDGDDVVAQLREKIEASGMPDAVREQAERELGRLERTSDQSPEYGWIRTYLDWLTEVPWDVRTEDNLDIAEARTVLDADHDGLEDVKDRILEYLAVRKLRRERGLAEATGRGSGAILTLVGPPGVGKTSLGESVARALGRHFVRVSLGGIHDEAEIRGHRRTYVGALPGRIVRALKDAGTKNPVMMLDEIDKVGADWRGDPSSALLEVLDPEQNHTFNDHYLEVDYDLSNVMFITTANTLNIPPPLMDRMEIIRIAGYTEDEKVEIARKHLIPHAVVKHGLDAKEWSIDDEALLTMIRRYTREAGVRNLERELSTLIRKAVKELMTSKKKSIAVTAASLGDYLGVPKFRYGEIEAEDLIGVVTGLAWTDVGGELLTIEGAMMPGKGRMTVTGNLRDVMKESISAAASYVRSRAVAFGIEPPLFDKRDIHVHVPEGATPKDGPSAGVAMVTAIVSVMTGIPVRRDVAMTGEITLRGRVLPIGGLKEKLLAAARGGMKTVLIPEENAKDLVEISDTIKKGLEIIPVTRMDEVLERALVRKPDPIEWDEASAKLAAQAAASEPAVEEDGSGLTAH